MRLFYQRKRNPNQIMQRRRTGEANTYTSTRIVKSGKFPKIPDRACKVFTCNTLKAAMLSRKPNARQSKTFCDIVLVIDAYRLVQS
jgi:hypothetical protein